MPGARYSAACEPRLKAGIGATRRVSRGGSASRSCFWMKARRASRFLPCAATRSSGFAWSLLSSSTTRWMIFCCGPELVVGLRDLREELFAPPSHPGARTSLELRGGELGLEREREFLGVEL